VEFISWKHLIALLVMWPTPTFKKRVACLGGLQTIWKEGQLRLPSAYHLPDIRNALSARILLRRHERFPIRPYVPNHMRCHWCQKFGNSQQRCAYHLICLSVVWVGAVRIRVSTHPTVWTAPEHMHQSTVNAFLQEKAIQELRVSEGLFFLDAPNIYRRKPTIRTQPFARSVRSPPGIDAATQITAGVNRCSASVACRKTVPSQSDACTQTEDLTTSTAPGVELRVCRYFTLDIRQTHKSTKSPAIKTWLSLSRSGTRKILHDTIIAPDCRVSPSDTSHSQTDRTTTPRDKQRTSGAISGWGAVAMSHIRAQSLRLHSSRICSWEMWMASEIGFLTCSPSSTVAPSHRPFSGGPSASLPHLKFPWVCDPTMITPPAAGRPFCRRTASTVCRSTFGLLCTSYLCAYMSPCYTSPCVISATVRRAHLENLFSQIPPTCIFLVHFYVMQIVWGRNLTDDRGTFVCRDFGLFLFNTGAHMHLYLRSGISSTLELTFCSLSIAIQFDL
jgi:hypothetical protein